MIQKYFAIIYSQSYKFLNELLVLVTASLPFLIVFHHFYLDSFTIMLYQIILSY